MILATLQGTYAAAASAPLTTSPVTTTTALEPDYEEEKLQFQRGGLMIYALPQLDARLSADSAQPTADYPAQLLQRADHAQEVAAMVLLGLMHERGYRLKQDYGLAMQWYRRASARGSSAADFFLGLGFFQGKGVPQDLAAAHDWMQRAAERGLIEAQVDAGWLCEYARGATPDYRCARQWYARAARSGNSVGAFDLGTLYYQGKGVPQDYVTARYWFDRAAAQGHSGAQYNLGVMALGHGQDADPVSAWQWFRLLQVAHYPGATESLRSVEASLSPYELAQAALRVRRWQAIHRPNRTDLPAQ